MKLSVHSRITIIFACIVTVVLMGFFVYFKSVLQQNTFQRIRSSLIKETSLAKTFLEHQTEGREGHSGKFDPLCDQIGRDLDLRVTVIGLDGKVLGDSQLDSRELGEIENHLMRPEVQTALKTGLGESQRFSTTIQEDLLYVAMVFGLQEKEGIVRIAMPLTEIEVVMDRLRNVLNFSLLSAFIVSILLSFLFSCFVSRPIEKVSAAANRIAAGDFSQRIYIKSNDEIGQLAHAFNEMAEQIKDRIEETETEKSRLEAVLLSMFEGVMVVDNEETILLMNRTLRELFSLQDDPLGKNPLEVIRNVDVLAIIGDTRTMASGVYSKEIVVHIPEERILLVHSTPIIRKGEQEGVVLVFHDVTELRKLEKVRQDFVANVSHELRTPLTSIKGYTETLLDGALDDPKNAGEFLKIIYAESDRLARLIGDILDLSRIESGKMSLDIKPCSMRPLVDEALNRFQTKIKEQDLSVQVSFAEDLPQVLADPARVGQVLDNLIDNAVKYTDPKGSLFLSGFARGTVFEVSVRDTGLGISEEDQDRIFERFYRVDKARSRELGGTGLGLSIVKHIVHAHSGEIFVNSSLGHGATFTITLPLA